MSAPNYSDSIVTRDDADQMIQEIRKLKEQKLMLVDACKAAETWLDADQHFTVDWPQVLKKLRAALKHAEENV